MVSIEKIQIGEEEKRNGSLIGVAKTSREPAEWRRFQWKDLNILGLPKRKEWPQCHRESSCKVCQSCFCQVEKEHSHLLISRDLSWL